MTPQPGDYFTVATTGRAARLIRFGERWFLPVPKEGCWANHCGIYKGDGLVIEANPNGVAVRSMHEYDHLHIAWSDRVIPEAERSLIVSAAEVMVGLPYSRLDIVAMVLQRFPAFVGLLARMRLNRGDRLICSQLVARAYRLAGIRLVPAKEDNFVTPGDLAALLTPKVVTA